MRRWAGLAAGVAALVIASKLLIENALGIDLRPAVEWWLTSAGPVGATAIVVLLAADIVLPVPSSLIMVLSGAVFGTFWGAVLALAGSIGGEWLGFELVRRYGKRASSRMVGDEELARLSAFFARYGTAAIVVTRPLPIVMETMSVVAGLSNMPRTTFLGASLAGTLPIVFVYAYAGARSREVGSVLPAAVILVTMSLAGWLVYRARRTGVSPRTPSSSASPD